MSRRIVIPGGSGAVGQLLAKHFHRRGDQVTVLSRRPAATAWRTLSWDGVHQGEWTREIEGSDIVINLAGRSVDCRYHAANRREIMNSRVDSTHAVGQAIAHAMNPPRVWLNASTATIYRHVAPHTPQDRAMDELSGEIGGAVALSEPGGDMSTWKFSIDVAMAWERAFFETRTPRVRKVALRSALTAIPCSSWLRKLTQLAKLGLGGAAGTGDQYVSWIHETDFIRAVEFLIARDDLDGPINLAAPNPLPNHAFMRALRDVLGVSIGPRLPEPLLRFGAAMLGSEAELILKSRRVVPRRLLDAGFEFRFPTWPEAASELLWRPGSGIIKLSPS